MQEARKVPLTLRSAWSLFFLRRFHALQAAMRSSAARAHAIAHHARAHRARARARPMLSLTISPSEDSKLANALRGF